MVPPRRSVPSSETARQPRAVAVADWLRAEILNGHMAPGQRVRQEELARTCHTSRIPVRQALQQLQHEGLVTLTAHVGARVAKLEFSELQEVYRIRERLEPLAIAESTKNITADGIAELWGYIHAMERLTGDDSDRHEWLELDRAFHLASFQAAGMSRLLRVIQELWDTTQQYRRLYMLLPTRLELAHTEHRMLMSTLERGDSEDAERIDLMHIRRTRLTLEEHQELFER